MTQRAKRSRMSVGQARRSAPAIGQATPALPDPPETAYILLSRKLTKAVEYEAKLAEEYSKQLRKLDKMDQLDPKYFMQQGTVVYQATILLQARESLRLMLRGQEQQPEA